MTRLTSIEIVSSKKTERRQRKGSPSNRRGIDAQNAHGCLTLLHPLHISISKPSVNVHVAQSEPDQTHSFTKRLLPLCASSELIISTSAYQRHTTLPSPLIPDARLPHLFRKRERAEAPFAVFKVKDNGKERRRIG